MLRVSANCSGPFFVCKIALISARGKTTLRQMRLCGYQQLMS